MPAVDLDLCYTPAVEVARRIAAKEMSPVEVMDNTLARIAEVNPVLNCFCFVYADEARDLARAAEAAVMRGDPLAPLHGVPVALKDFTPTAGKRTTLGSYTHEHWVPRHDARIAVDLRRAGTILVGKTTTPEFAYSSLTHSPLWGITRNPWNPERTPGGSSGGSGAAVAAGCVALAEGSDMGGSVRIPAAWSGIVGLKPSLGRIPFTVLPSQFDQISHFGPLTRTMADCAAFLAATQGPDDMDIQTIDVPLDLSGPLPADVRGLRLGLSRNLGYLYVDPEVDANLLAVADTLRAAGAEVEEVAIPWRRGYDEAWVNHWAAYLAGYFADYLPEFRHQMDPRLVTLIEHGVRLTAVDLKRVEILRTEQWRGVVPLFRRYDALLMPTMTRPALPVDGADPIKPADREPGLAYSHDLTSLINNIAPCPALSVPSGWTRDGLPTAVQVVGRRHDDMTCLRIGAALEHLRPWADRRPPL